MKRTSILGCMALFSAALAGCGDSASQASTEAEIYWRQPDTTFVPILGSTDAKSMSRASMWVADPLAKAVFMLSPAEGSYASLGVEDREPIQINVPAKLAVSRELGLAVYDLETKSVNLFMPGGTFIRGFEVEFTPAVMEISTAPIGYTFAIASTDFEGPARVVIIRTDALGTNRDTLLSPVVGPQALRGADATPGQTLIAPSDQGMWVWSKAVPDTVFEVAPRSARVIPVRVEDHDAIALLSDPASQMLWFTHGDSTNGSYSAYDTRQGVDAGFLGVRTTTGQFSPRIVHDGIVMGWYRGLQGRPAAIAYDLNVTRFERQELAND